MEYKKLIKKLKDEYLIKDYNEENSDSYSYKFEKDNIYIKGINCTTDLSRFIQIKSGNLLK